MPFQSCTAAFLCNFTCEIFGLEMALIVAREQRRQLKRHAFSYKGIIFVPRVVLQIAVVLSPLEVSSTSTRQ